MSFIKNIFNGEVDKKTRNQFVRFGKGIYENRAVIKLQKSKDIKVSSTFEYANDFVELIAEISDARFTGVILSKENLGEFFKSRDREVLESKKAGLYVHNVNEIESKIINEIKDKVYYFLLDAKADGIEFKCKKKLPKPGKGNAKVDGKFCVLRADLKYWPKIRDEFFPDVSENAKKAVVRHTIEIENIKVQDGIKDFEQMRLLAKRQGKLTRFLEVDKKQEKKECEFEV